MNDNLWKHFGTLLRQLSSIGEQPVLVAGGFGLILKQQWLLSDGRSKKVTVPLERWKDPQLRSTKDVDIVIDLDLLSDPGNQNKVVEILRQNGFKEKVKLWVWTKELTAESVVDVEIHAPIPGADDADLKVSGNRVKSRGENLIHGYANAELVGQDLVPYSFHREGIEVTIPNPVTYLLMKLTAAEDRWSEALNPESDREKAAESRDQAFKHALDAYRLLAMVTKKEYESASEVASSIASSEAYQNAKRIVRDSFLSSESWNIEDVRRDWEAGDLETLQTVLAEFFGLT